MHGRHLVLQIGVADDDPLVAEVVRLALEPRPRLPRDGVEHLLQVVLGPDELARGERLEDDSARASGLQSQFRVQRHPRGREREQAILRWTLELLAPEEDVGQTHSLLGARRPACPSRGRSSPARRGASREAGDP